MKWKIDPNAMNDFVRKLSKKPGTRSPTSSSPAFKQTPGKRGTNVVWDPTHNSLSQPQVAQSPQAATPNYRTFAVAPNEAYTPERGSSRRPPQHPVPAQALNFDEMSPYPPQPARTQPFGLSDNITGSPPTLSSTYMDDGPSMITPAPRRQHPTLGPPSTMRLPSHYMNQASSPAAGNPFFNFMGSTPARPMPETSPLKGGRLNGLGDIPSSSPPPPNLASPSRPRPSSARRMPSVEVRADMRRTNGDLTINGRVSDDEAEAEDEDEDEEETGLDISA